MPIKAMHYWVIHRKITNRVWRNLDNRSREIIAADVEHKSREFKDFEKYVNSETDRLFNDENYYLNDPYSFRYSRDTDSAAAA
jgi:hypothetical protein